MKVEGGSELDIVGRPRIRFAIELCSGIGEAAAPAVDLDEGKPQVARVLDAR